MKRIFFLGLVICLVGWAGKAQAQKVEKVDGMLYRIIGADEVALVGGDIKTMEYTVPSTVTIDGRHIPLRNSGTRRKTSRFIL